MEINGFEIDEYNVYKIKQGARSWTCPKCSHERTVNKTQRCLSVFWDTGLGQCNHCKATIQLHTYKKKSAMNTQKVYKVPAPRQEEKTASDALAEYVLKDRGIGREALDKLKIVQGKRKMPKAQKEVSVIEFPYFVNGQCVNVKYRGPNKDFMFEKDCELVMYNLDNVMHESECIIVEGEWDAAAFVDAGFLNVTSVPNGFTPPKPDGSSSIKLSYLDNYYQFFENKERIYLAVDNDEPGNHGRAELIRRFGAEKCWNVDFADCKDANDYLRKYGKEALAATIANARQIPLENVESVYDFRSDLENFYINGAPRGFTTGMEGLDKMYSIEPGQYTIVTGPPQSGKSEFVDSICLGYALRYGMKTAFASAENKPNYLHADKILRKINGFRPSSTDYLKSKKWNRAIDFYSEHFFHVEFRDGYNLQKILAKFEELVHRKGVRVFVIDPFNKAKLKESASKNINDYTADYLMEIDTFCRKTNSIVYLVAHPTKMKKIDGTNTYPMPDAYDIKGGGEMFDMAYHILGLTRNMEGEYVSVRTLKVKFQHLGNYGEEGYFKWNINNGRYETIDFEPKEGGTIPMPVWNNRYWLEEEKDNEEKPHEFRIDSFEKEKFLTALETNEAPF
jgi:twinkle protein